MRLTVSPIVCFATLLAVTVFVANSPSEPQETPPRTYLGFDRNDYPGDDAMKLLRRDFAFTGYWLGSPPDDTTNSWTGKRELLRSEGFGFVLLFGDLLPASCVTSPTRGSASPTILKPLRRLLAARDSLLVRSSSLISRRVAVFRLPTSPI